MTDKLTLTDAEWREKLSPEKYHILRQAGTERAFTGEYEQNKAEGEYACAGCGALLAGSQPHVRRASSGLRVSTWRRARRQISSSATWPDA